MVHGDLLGNVLFAPGEPPAVIDWPACHRPPAWAAAGRPQSLDDAHRPTAARILAFARARQ